MLNLEPAECKFRTPGSKKGMFKCTSPCLVVFSEVTESNCYYCELKNAEKANCYDHINKKASKAFKPLDTKETLVGDMLGNALKKIGITDEKVSNWLGKPCSCPERRDKLNRAHAWAKRILSGKTENAKEHLDDIINN